MIAEGTYRARGQGAPVLGANPKSGVQGVAALFDVVLGPYTGARLEWRGHFNTEENGERAIRALRAAGWKGRELGAWQGFGSEECEIVVTHEAGAGEFVGKKFPRIAFVNRLRTLKVAKPLGDLEIELLSKRFAHLLAAPLTAGNGAGGMGSGGAGGYDPDTGEILGDDSDAGLASEIVGGVPEDETHAASSQPHERRGRRWHAARRDDDLPEDPQASES